MIDFSEPTGRFPSVDGQHQIAYYMVEPKGTPKAVVQFCHGMAEHAKRYATFGRFLADNGFVFVICDHLGHGQSVNNEEDLGYFGKQEGWRNLVEDAATCTMSMKSRYPGIPYVIAGHSMGSFVTRAYLSIHPELADAAIIMGTGDITPLIAMGRTVARAVASLKGERFRSKLLDQLSFGSYNKRIQERKTSSDWLSRDADEVEKYRADPLCGFLFTASGTADIASLIQFVSRKEWVNSVKKEMPILLISGDADPVGGYGKGVLQVYARFQAAGMSGVTVKLYPDGRHELLNETNKQEVSEDILNWISTRACKRRPVGTDAR